MKTKTAIGSGIGVIGIPLRHNINQVIKDGMTPKIPSLRPVIKLPPQPTTFMPLRAVIKSAYPVSRTRELLEFTLNPAYVIAKNIVRKTNDGRKNYASIYKNLILGVICVFFAINAITSVRTHYHITRGADLFETGERYVNSN